MRNEWIILLGIFLAISFVLWTINLLIASSRLQAEVATHVEAISTLKTVNRLMLGIDQRDADIDTINAAERVKKNAADREQINKQLEELASIGLYSDRVKVLGQHIEALKVYAQFIDSSTSSNLRERTRKAAVDQRFVLATQMDETIILSRQRLSKISIELQALWKQVYLVVYVSCVLAIFALILLIVNRVRFRERNRMQEEVAQALNVKSQFLRNVSHELRTPITAIAGMADLLNETSLSSEQKEYLSLVDMSTDHLLHVVDEILDYSQLAAGEVTLEQVPFDLRKLFWGLEQTYRLNAGKKRLALSAVLDPEIPDKLIGDPHHLYRILAYLLGNAIKFTEAGNVSLKATIVENLTEKMTIRFDVEDTGIGIADQEQQSIFEGFRQVDGSQKRKHSGRGLGLAILKHIVELQNGTMTLTSQLGKGSCFSIDLQFELAVLDNVHEVEMVRTAGVNITSGTTVLVVEDHPTNQLFLSRLLPKWGCEVTVAGNGLRALEILENQQFDLAIIDMQMPEMDGYETIGHIRHKLSPPTSTMPIIAMTAHAMKGEDEKCLNAGASAYISKPIDQAILQNIVAQYTVATALGDPSVSSQATSKKLDLGYLQEASDGDNEFMADMIHSFIQNHHPAIDVMEEHIRNTDFEAVRKAAHKMGPTFAYVGVLHLEETTLALEKAAAARKDFEEVKRLFGIVKQEGEVIVKALEKELMALGMDDANRN